MRKSRSAPLRRVVLAYDVQSDEFLGRRHADAADGERDEDGRVRRDFAEASSWRPARLVEIDHETRSLSSSRAPPAHPADLRLPRDEPGTIATAWRAGSSACCPAGSRVLDAAAGNLLLRSRRSTSIHSADRGPPPSFEASRAACCCFLIASSHAGAVSSSRRRREREAPVVIGPSAAPG